MFSSLRKSFAIVFLIAVYTLYLTLQGMQSVDRKEDVFLEMPHDWIPLKSPTDLAFYFQTDRVSRRMEFSIASVRRFFPEAPFYLLSDGGDLFTDVAAKWNVTAVHSAMRMHLAQYANENFTCQRHLLRLAEAARWAQDKGARYLMIWEEDTRMLRPVRGFPDADVITMGNIHNDHCGVFSPESMQRLEQKKEKDLAPGDLRRMRQRDRYTARQGFSAGPGSTWKIHSLLSALGTSKSEDLDELYQVQDLCWEDFALMTDQAVQRSPEVQQMLSPYGDLDSQRPADPLRNLQCLWCLDSCKSSCGCTGLRWGVEWLQYLAVWLLWPLAPTFSIIEREKILWSRPCQECSAGLACWESCQQQCMGGCPAVTHPHKETTLDCEDDGPSVIRTSTRPKKKKNASNQERFVWGWRPRLWLQDKYDDTTQCCSALVADV